MEQRLTVRIAGPGVPVGKIGLKDLQRIVHPLEQAVRALLPANEPPPPTGGRPRKPTVRLLLSGIEPGSAVANLELDADLAPTLDSLAPDPLGRLVAGAAADGGKLPADSRRHLERMARSLPRGFEYVELTLPDRAMSARIYRHDPEEALSETEAVLTISGRLVSIDFRTGTARLQIQSGGKRKVGTQLVPLRFPDELANDMQRCARQQVSVHGVATMTADRVVESLAVQRLHVNLDDRRGLWAPKRFRWPSADERLDNVDMDEFLRTSRDDGKDDV